MSINFSEIYNNMNFNEKKNQKKIMNSYLSYNYRRILMKILEMNEKSKKRWSRDIYIITHISVEYWNLYQNKC